MLNETYFHETGLHLASVEKKGFLKPKIACNTYVKRLVAVKM